MNESELSERLYQGEIFRKGQIFGMGILQMKVLVTQKLSNLADEMLEETFRTV